MPEQEFLPPRRPGRFPGPDVPPGYHDEEPPPWAGLPSVVPSRPAPDYPMGSWRTAGPPPPRVQEQVPDWAGPDAVVRAISIRLGVPCHAGDTLTLSGHVDRVDGAEQVVSVTGRCRLGDHVTGTVRITR